MNNNSVKIILNDWEGYPLYREKIIGKKKIKCGLELLIKNLAKHQSNIEIEIYLIITSNFGRKEYYFTRVLFWLKIIHLFKKYSQHKKSLGIYTSLKKEYPFIKTIIYKDNLGLDIGAYNYGYQILKREQYSGYVIFMNSSVTGPDRDQWFEDYETLYNYNENIGVVGISMNSHNDHRSPPVFDPHVQSYFLFTEMKKIIKTFPKNLPGFKINYNKEKLIHVGEIGFSRELLNAGYSIACRIYGKEFYTKDNDWKWPTGDPRVFSNLPEWEINRI